MSKLMSSDAVVLKEPSFNAARRDTSGGNSILAEIVRKDEALESNNNNSFLNQPAEQMNSSARLGSSRKITGGALSMAGAIFTQPANWFDKNALQWNKVYYSLMEHKR